MKETFSLFESYPYYSHHFMDKEFWEPYVREVYNRHSATPANTVRAGLAGTCPTFIVDDRWVIKFFGRLFEGEKSFLAEWEANQLLLRDPAVRAASLVASGRLFEQSEEWPWPYLIFEYLPGVSIGEVYDQVSHEDKLRIAIWMGEFTRRLHSLALGGSLFFQPDWKAFLTLLEQQRASCQANHHEWASLPGPLIAQIEDYLLPLDQLVDLTALPYLIHADLTQDHLLGRLVDGGWETLGIIDFGDAMVADLAYELVALHFDLFHCDKRLLEIFLDTYGMKKGDRKTLLRRAMNMALLHRFDVFVCVSKYLPQAHQASTLEELAEWVWGI